MNRRHLYTIGSLLGIAVVGGWCWTQGHAPAAQGGHSASAAPPAAAPSVDGASSWAVGSHRLYRFTYETSGEYVLSGDASASGAIAMSLGGNLFTKVVESGARRVLEFTIEPKTLNLRGVPSTSIEGLKAQISRPFRVTYALDGSISEVALARGTDRHGSTLLRELVGHLQVTTRAGTAWTAVESEPGGQCLVAMQRSGPNGIRKQKLKYVKVARSGRLVAPEETVGVPSFVRSNAIYELDAGGRLLNAEIDQAMTAKVDVVKGSVDSRLRASFEHVTSDLAQVAPLDAPTVALAAPRRLLDSPADSPVASGPDKSAPPTAELLATIERAERMNSAEHAADASELHVAQHQLSTAIARDEQVLSEVLKSPLNQPVLSAIGAAGSPAAQKALLEVANDGKNPKELRKEAIDAFHEVPDASPETLDGLLDVADKDPELEENALLAYGGLVNRGRSADPRFGDDWVDELVARYERAKTDAERAMILDALGNTGSEAALDTLEQVLRSASPELRVIATKNLRLIAGARVDAILTSLLASTSERSLREAALFATGFRQYAGVRSALDDLLRREADAELRTSALSVVVNFLHRDSAREAEAIIRWVAEHDANEDLRNQARAALQA